MWQLLTLDWKLINPEYMHFKDNKLPEYLAMFPHRKMPAFKSTSGFALVEGAAIAHYREYGSQWLVHLSRSQSSLITQSSPGCCVKESLVLILKKYVHYSVYTTPFSLLHSLVAWNSHHKKRGMPWAPSINTWKIGPTLLVTGSHCIWHSPTVSMGPHRVHGYSMRTPWGLHKDSLRTRWGLYEDFCEDSVRTPLRTPWTLCKDWYIDKIYLVGDVIVSTSVLGSLLCHFCMTKMLLYFQVYLTFGQSDILTTHIIHTCSIYLFFLLQWQYLPHPDHPPCCLSTFCLFITCCVWIYNIACKNHLKL